MHANELKEEIVHQRMLIQEHQKHIRLLEMQAAKFGLSAPTHLQIEINETTDAMQKCREKIDTIKRDFIAKLSEEYIQLSNDLKLALNQRNSTWPVGHTEEEYIEVNREMRAQRSQVKHQVRMLLIKIRKVEQQIYEIRNL